MTTNQLSEAQKRFLTRVATAPVSGYLTPAACNRNGVALVSAWYRTAESLQARGLIRLVRVGDRYAALPVNQTTRLDMLRRDVEAAQAAVNMWTKRLAAAKAALETAKKEEEVQL